MLSRVVPAGFGSVDPKTAMLLGLAGSSKMNGLCAIQVRLPFVCSRRRQGAQPGIGLFAQAAAGTQVSGAVHSQDVPDGQVLKLNEQAAPLIAQVLPGHGHCCWLSVMSALPGGKGE